MIPIVLSFQGIELAFPLKNVSGLEWSWGAPTYHGHRVHHKATTARKSSLSSQTSINQNPNKWATGNILLQTQMLNGKN